MVWRLPRKTWEKGKGPGNRRAFRRVVMDNQQPGVLAYAGKEPVGWCAIAPRSVYVTLERSRVLKPVDDQPVWSITCLYIRRDFRKCGLSSQLIKAATKFARSRGARVVEGYPVEPYAADMPDTFAWTGLHRSFTKAGFKEVLRRSRSRPIMRRRA